MSCINNQGQAVDWWVMLKMPNGVSFKYCDSTSCDNLQSQSDLTENSSPLMATMA